MKFPDKLFVMRHKDEGDADTVWFEAQSSLQYFDEEGRVAVYELLEEPREMVIVNKFKEKNDADE